MAPCGGVLVFTEGLGSIVYSLFDELDNISQDEDEVLETIGALVLQFCDHIASIVSLRDIRTAPSTCSFPAVLLADLSVLRLGELYDILSQQDDSLKFSFSSEDATEVEDKFN